MKHSKEDLKILQKLPLDIKVGKTAARIMEWHRHFEGNVYVSFSGGKDSTVLLDIARQLYPDIKAVFSNTGLEYPEIKDFVKTVPNVDWVKPKMVFDEVVKLYGWNYPSKEVSLAVYYARKGSKWAINWFDGKNTDGSISKFKSYRYPKWKYLLDSPFIFSNKCCLIMKEKPLDDYGKKTKCKPIIATLAEESQRRTDSWLATGCNGFDSKKQTSQPMSFWTEQDVLQYLKLKRVPYSSVYGDIAEDKGKLHLTGEQRTGCMYCPVGCHLDSPNKFQRMAITHPKLHSYCMRGGELNADNEFIPNKNGLGLGKVLDYLGIPYGAESEDE